MASTTQLKFKDGSEVVVHHQFGTVRRLLNESVAGEKTNKDGEKEPVGAFAEFHTEAGRVLVNPDAVASATLLKDE